jgi:hypothetical protein
VTSTRRRRSCSPRMAACTARCGSRCRAPLPLAPFLEHLQRLLERHPALSAQTRVINSPINIVAEGLDVALVVGQVGESSFVGRLLGRVTWVLAAAPSYLERCGRPSIPSDLAKHQGLRLLSCPEQAEWTLVDRRGRQVTVAVHGSERPSRTGAAALSLPAARRLCSVTQRASSPASRGLVCRGLAHRSLGDRLATRRCGLRATGDARPTR